MWEKHKRELLGCAMAPVLTVLLLLLIVYVFERFGIHVPGTREMWIGLIGAVIGGVFTLFGVLITIYKQEESDDEKVRIENMPILGFSSYQSSLSESNPILIVGISEDELATSLFPTDESDCYSILKVTTANKKSVFNLCVTDFYISNKGVLKKTDAFAPSNIRLINDEDIDIMIYHPEKLDSNYLCVIRFAYEDIFKNKYIQDIPFEIFDRKIYGYREQVIKIRDIMQPIYSDSTDSLLYDTVKSFTDYENFLQKY